mgnify:CR=1 FL=1
MIRYYMGREAQGLRRSYTEQRPPPDVLSRPVRDSIRIDAELDMEAGLPTSRWYAHIQMHPEYGRYENQGTIYGLFDQDGALRYIGQTTGWAEDRWKEHHSSRQGTSDRMTAWIAGLRAIGRLPAVRILERCELAERTRRESWWIKWAIGHGCGLLNSEAHERKGRGHKRLDCW